MALVVVASLAACSGGGEETSEDAVAPTISAAPTPSEVRFYAPADEGGSPVKEPTPPAGKPNTKVPPDILPTLPPVPSVAPTGPAPVPGLPSSAPIPSDLPTELLPPSAVENPNKTN